MKRFLSLCIAVLMIVSSFVSCRSVSENGTSSDGKVETYLSGRLGADFSRDIVIGTAEDAAAYGIDMSDFRDEGYIIRSLGNETVIFGATEEGLDRGARYYVNNCTEEDTVDVVYGEGPAVKRITVAGRDIAEYSIYLFEGADECHTAAAEDLQKYLELASGIMLPIVREPAEHMIALEQVDTDDPRYEILGDEGFTLEVREDGNLYIVGGRYRGCLYGVYEFLEEYIGWRFAVNLWTVETLSDDDLYLYESELVEISADLSDTQVPSFAYRHDGYLTYGQDCKRVSNMLKRLNKDNTTAGAQSEYNLYGVSRVSCHGLANIAFKSDYFDFLTSYERYWHLMQPCFTNPQFIEACELFYTEYVDAQLAEGKEIGKEIVEIDLGMNDCGVFCQCQDCLEYVALDKSQAGPVLNFVNHMAEWANENYEGLYVSFLSYVGADVPPEVTRPLSNVNVSYTLYFNPVNSTSVCFSHKYDGTECTGVRHGGSAVDNRRWAENLEKWCEISDRVTIWTYPGMWYYVGMESPLITNLREDMKYLHDLGVYGVYPCFNRNDTQEYMMLYLLMELAWDADMSEEEYRNKIAELLYIFYGDGGKYVGEYLQWIEDISVDGCWSMFMFTAPQDRIKFAKVETDFEYMLTLFDRAISEAQTENIEEGLIREAMNLAVMGLIVTHDPWYLNGDAESRERYTEIYNKFKETALEYNYYMHTDAMEKLTEGSFNIEQNLGAVYNSSSSNPDWWKWQE